MRAPHLAVRLLLPARATIIIPYPVRINNLIMPVLSLTDDTILQEILYMLDPSLTFEEVPRDVITARTVLRSANRRVLRRVNMTETAYDALPSDDPRRADFEEAAIRYAVAELVPVVAQLVQVNANGLMTRYQEIDWLKRKNQLTSEAGGLLDIYAPGGAEFYGARSAESARKL